MSDLALKRILVADHQPEVCRRLADFFTMVGCRVDTAASGQDILDKVATNDYAVALLDCRLSGGNGLEVLAELSARYPETSVVMLSGEPSLEIVVAALRRGAFDFVVKPFDLAELTEIVHKAADQHELLRMHQAMSTQTRQGRNVDTCVGASTSI